MRKNTSKLSYTTPTCRVKEIGYELNFLATGDFGNDGNAGKDLEGGDEYNF